MAIWTKVYNLLRQPTRQQNLESDKYLPYFNSNDNFPLKWHQIISESPSATACVSTINDFLEGVGFSEEELEKRIVNARGETLFQVHQKTCKDYAEYEGFYWLLRYDAMGRITEWENLAFENCRLGKPDQAGDIHKIYYNPYFGTDDFRTIQDKSTICYDAFAPKQVKAQIADQGDKFKGQVFFFGTTTALSRFYPMPEAYSGAGWMKIEHAIATYHEKNLDNGLLQAIMLTVFGDPDAASTNPEDSDDATPITNREAFAEMMDENFMGKERVGNLWVNWVTDPAEKPIIDALPSNNNSELFLAMDNQATKKITIAFKVPSILANIHEGVTLGGDGNMVRVAVKLMQQRVIKSQRKLTDAYQLILSQMAKPYFGPVEIAPYNPYPELEVIDDKIWNEMSTQERRDWINSNTEIVLEDDAPEPTMPQPGISNAIPVEFPEAVIKTVQRALDYNDKMGINCIGKSRELSEAIIANKPLGLNALKRLHRYTKNNVQFENSPFQEGCNVIKYGAFGGKAMEMFLERKLKELNAWINE